MYLSMLFSMSSCISMPMLHVHVHATCPSPYYFNINAAIHIQAACPCPCRMSRPVLHVYARAACPYPYYMFMSVLHFQVHATCTCHRCLSSPCCKSMSMLYVYCMSMLQPMSMLLVRLHADVHVYAGFPIVRVHAACPVVHVHAACACACHCCMYAHR
jgi:hypothetical protein